MNELVQRAQLSEQVAPALMSPTRIVLMSLELMPMALGSSQWLTGGGRKYPDLNQKWVGFSMDCCCMIAIFRHGCETVVRGRSLSGQST